MVEPLVFIPWKKASCYVDENLPLLMLPIFFCQSQKVDFPFDFLFQISFSICNICGRFSIELFCILSRKEPHEISHWKVAPLAPTHFSTLTADLIFFALAACHFTNFPMITRFLSCSWFLKGFLVWREIGSLFKRPI